MNVLAIVKKCWERLYHSRRQIGRGRTVRKAQRLRQPAGTVEQPLGLLRHLAFLEMVQELGGMVALGLPDRFENAGLGDTAEVVVDRRPPARRYHVEAYRASKPVCLGKALLDAMHR